LILRGEDESPGWREELEGAGIEPTFLKTLKTEPVGAAEMEKISAFLQSDTDVWLVLSSRRGVQAWKNRLEKSNQKMPAKLAVVGEKTAAAVKTELDIYPSTVADYLQDCLEIIAQKEKNARVISLTSDEGVKKIRPRVPMGMHFERHAIYKTKAFLERDPALIKKLASEDFDFCLFTSPSTFEALQNRPQLMANIESEKWKIAAWGDTTAGFIRTQGLPVALVPQQPELDALIGELLNY